MKIQLLVFPGMTLLDLAGPLQVWANWPGGQFQFVWKTRGIIETDAHIGITSDTSFQEAWTDPDILFVPGGSDALFELMGDEEVISFLRSRGQKAGWVTSVCSGSHLLGAAGLIDGYKSTGHWFTRSQLDAFGAEVSNERVCIDRNRASGGGVTAGVDFGLTIMAKILGEDVAKATQLGLEYAPKPPFQSGTPYEAEPHIIEMTKQRYGGEAAMDRVRAIHAALSAARN